MLGIMALEGFEQVDRMEFEFAGRGGDLGVEVGVLVVFPTVEGGLGEDGHDDRDFSFGGGVANAAEGAQHAAPFVAAVGVQIAKFVAAPVIDDQALVPDPAEGAQGEGMPWYPSVRLFRQTVAGDWRPVLERMRAALD